MGSEADGSMRAIDEGDPRAVTGNPAADPTAR